MSATANFLRSPNRSALPAWDAAPADHKAVRGTIISLGTFAKGAKEGALFVGAAPITLIDGKRLLDLCIKHQVGIKRRPVEIYEIDEAFFEERFEREEESRSSINSASRRRQRVTRTCSALTVSGMDGC
jgi:hypothetical protein